MKNNFEIITDALGKHLNVTLWKNKRIYINGYGFNTKKCKQTIYICLERFIAVCYTNCPSQTSQWCSSQSAQVVVQLEKYVRLARLINYNTKDQAKSIEQIEIEMVNEALDLVPVMGVYTQWREVRVAINRFGKLATRNRQFMITFTGTMATAPKNFIPVEAEVFALLKDEEMLEPYKEPADRIKEIIAFAAYRKNQIQNN